MYHRTRSTRPSPTSSSARLAATLAITCAVLLSACVGDAPSGLRSSASSATRTSSSTSPLGSASGFAVLGATTVTCTGASSVAGDVGVSPGTAITGFNPDCTLTGTLHAGDAVAAQAQADAAAAYASLSNSTCDRTFDPVQELSGLTLTSGTYCFPSSAMLSAGGVLTLSGGGPFIFKVTSTLITFTGSSVVLTGGAACSDVTWLVGSSATLGGAVTGNILAHTSIGMDPGASLTGSAIALGGAVTMSGGNTVTLCGTSGGGGGRDKEKCNQGVGNGPEGCDPGNSNQGNDDRSNDERGGIPGHPGRKGGNGKR